MAKKAEPAQPNIYQLKITLNDIKPPVWRRVQVHADTPLDVLHVIIQLAMGWEDSHLHMFKIAGKTYGMPDDEGFGFGELEDELESEFALEQVAPAEKAKFTYLYDFGDSWEHTILVEKILPADPGVDYPICLDGARACPPEDSGGVWGYLAKLDVLTDPKHEDYEEIADWMGEDFDPEVFSVEDVNEEFEYIDDYLDEMALADDDTPYFVSPEEFEQATQEGIEAVKSLIMKSEKAANGIVLTLPYTPESFIVTFQYVAIAHGESPDAKISLEIGPQNAPIHLTVSGADTDIARIKKQLGLK